MVMEAQDTKIMPGYKLTEVGVIPEEWDVRKLSEVCNYQNGTSLEKYFNGLQGLSVISIGNYSIDGKYIDTNSYIDWKYYKEIKRFILCHNELCMILNDKTSIGAIIGRVLLIDEDNKYVFNQRSMRLVPHEIISPFYLYHIINSDLLHSKIVSLAKPGTQIYVNTGDITGLDIPIPKSAEEQRLIATALSDIDALITSLDKLIAKKRDIKQATMQQLLTGKTRLPGFSKGLKPTYKQTEVGIIPEDWGMYSLGDIVTKVGSGITPRGGGKVYKKEGRPFLRSQNVGWGHLLLDDIVFIDEETHSSFPTTEIKQNDVLLNITGASIGRSAVVNNRLIGGNVNQHVCIIRADANKLSSYYLNFFLLSEIGQEQIDSFQAGGNRQGLNFGQIKSFQIPLPEKQGISSLLEQQAIATVLSNMDAEIAALEQKRAKTRMVKQGMMQELLTGKTRLL